MRLTRTTVLVIAAAAMFSHAAVDTAGVPWVPMFNGRDLTNWHLLKGQDSSAKVVDGVILGDPGIAGQGCFFSNDSFSSYDFRLEYKWAGTYAWDAGYMIHCQNEPGKEWPKTCWPTSLEFQICDARRLESGPRWPSGQLWTSGDIFTINTTARMKTPGNESPYGPIAVAPASQACVKAGWNVCVGLIRESAGKMIVNGTHVNGYADLQLSENAKPVVRGRIGLQFEAGSVFYRNIEIRPYDAAFSGLTTISATSRIHAAKKDNYVGALTTAACSDTGSGQMVTSQRSADWITYYRVDFGASSPAKFFARCMTTGDSNKVRVLVDGPSDSAGSGREVAVVSAPKSAFGTVEAPLTGVTGKHQLYLRLDKGVSLNWFQFGSSVGVAQRRAGQGLQASLAVGPAYSDRVRGDVVFPLSLARPGDVRLSVFSLNGRSLFCTTFRRLAAGATNLRVSRSTGGRGDGTWVYTLSGGGHTLCGTVMIQPH